MNEEVNKLEKVLELREEELLMRSEVSLILNSYDDIFSSFDPRSYLHRSLSIDLLDEAKRATKDVGNGNFELRFLLSATKRSLEKEMMIKKRLKEHFRHHLIEVEKENGKIIKQGFLFIFFGLIFMFIAAYVLFYFHEQISFFKELMIVLLEPGGWFLFWEGLDLMIFETKKIKPDLIFYRRMQRARIVFSHF